MFYQQLFCVFQHQPDVHLLLLLLFLCAEGSASDPSHNCPLLSRRYGATGHASSSSESAAVLRPSEQVLVTSCRSPSSSASSLPVLLLFTQDAPGGGGGGVEVETTSEGSYECTSPDDISLPPLAETPEVVHSDLEEGFWSHSFHTSQQSQQQPEPAGAGPAQRGSGPPPLTRSVDLTSVLSTRAW